MMWWEDVIYGGISFTTGVGAYQIGKGIYRGIFSKPAPQKVEEKSPVESPPLNSPYRSIATPIEGSYAPPPEVIGWAWGTTRNGMGGILHAHMCPKCLGYQLENYQVIVPKHCTCTQYLKSHFHFECVKCEFRAIMRTADDREEKETSPKAS